MVRDGSDVCPWRRCRMPEDEDEENPGLDPGTLPWTAVSRAVITSPHVGSTRQDESPSEDLPRLPPRTPDFEMRGGGANLHFSFRRFRDEVDGLNSGSVAWRTICAAHMCQTPPVYAPGLYVRMYGCITRFVFQ